LKKLKPSSNFIVPLCTGHCSKRDSYLNFYLRFNPMDEIFKMGIIFEYSFTEIQSLIPQSLPPLPTFPFPPPSREGVFL